MVVGFVVAWGLTARLVTYNNPSSTDKVIDNHEQPDPLSCYYYCQEP